MNIAVINIRDLIKCIVILCILVIILVAGVKVVKGKEEFENENDEVSFEDNSSFLYCLEMEIPLMASDEQEEDNTERLNSSYKILDSELAMLYSLNDKEEIKENSNVEIAEEEIKEDDEEKVKTIDINEKLETSVINENNIEASFTNSEADIKVKNQSSHNIDELIKESNYEIKNKNKVIIYHTHTCESYTASENYNYEMTGAYRTTDLNYTVAKVRR